MSNKFDDEILTLHLSRKEVIEVASALTHSGGRDEAEKEIIRALRNYFGAKAGWTVQFNQDLNTRLERDRVGDGGDPTAIQGPLEYCILDAAGRSEKGGDPEVQYRMAHLELRGDCTRLGQDWSLVEPRVKEMFARYYREKNPNS